jgi:thioredoxin-like negative regulator of GroEL
LAVIVAAATLASTRNDPARLVARAEAAARAGDWEAALAAWRAVNQSRRAAAASLLGEARACLHLDRAAQALQALDRAIAARPAEPEPWLLKLGVLHVEDRIVEAQRIGWQAFNAVPPASRQEVLRAWTLALLADTPDDLARQTLQRWIAADPADDDARAALLARMATMPRPSDTDRTTRIATLTTILARNPQHVAAREALVAALADAGEPDRGRAVLEAWPAAARDARYLRLKGRWDLEYDHQPARAVAAFQRALAELPHDWKTHYRLARALKILGRLDDARAEAATVARLRETLAPDPLGQRLARAFSHLDDPQSRLDLAHLCAQVGLTRLADAWRSAAAQPNPSPSTWP